MSVAAVIPAGGQGRRMGGRKQYLELAGEPILLRTLRPFLEHPRVILVVVALPPEDTASPPPFLPAEVEVVAGGRERGDSVRAALAAVPDTVDAVLVHDAARPLVTGDVIDRVLAAVDTGIGALAAIPVADTLKRVNADGVVEATVDRAGLWRAQTPQGFPRAMIVDAYARAAEEGIAATDEAGLVERYGGRVVVVDGSARNIKITRPEDLDLALRLLREPSA
ncbi:MAG TPA: 2-C-methyl-D-erythritol 4-phosphate cytidylyltransferase [Longimicrobiales bacterium]|nr:2-C-methyl-D-erythritol 4-phosphate cytidylyltransferase [Longimicrobiales bacterium]